ncbi:hypothetical protein LL912_12830 [Niabella sp. CC-SYL272]|uniref:hypothetical protein n=1 Tax=Niabella agricola TaxID=2891571 RepID=UPI001F2E0DA0|nr:hypothetical protein [Niabella agricola]MCF3109657.1 hypothetical protein [Niabella agricola]
MRFFDFFNGTNKKRDLQKGPGTQPAIPLDKELELLAAGFIQKYTVRYPGLDFSVTSLKILDDLLQDASGFYEEMTAEQQQKIIKGAGAYIFEVARKHIGGSYYWYQKLDQPIFITGQPFFETSILAFNQVRNRLQNGSGDDVPGYFEGYTRCVQQRRSAIII